MKLLVDTHASPSQLHTSLKKGTKQQDSVISKLFFEINEGLQQRLCIDVASAGYGDNILDYIGGLLANCFFGIMAFATKQINAASFKK